MLLVIGFLFMLFLFVVISVLSGVSASFLDIPSVLVILVPLLFFCLVSKSGKIIGNYIKMSFKKEHIYTAAELKALYAALKNTVKFVFLSGGFGFFAGLIASLLYFESKDRLGPNLAISLLTVMYSITISCFVFFPVQAWAENKINTLKDDA